MASGAAKIFAALGKPSPTRFSAPFACAPPSARFPVRNAAIGLGRGERGIEGGRDRPRDAIPCARGRTGHRPAFGQIRLGPVLAAERDDAMGYILHVMQVVSAVLLDALDVAGRE